MDIAVIEEVKEWRAGEHQDVRGGWGWTVTYSRATAPLLSTSQDRELVSVTTHGLELLKA